MTIKANIAQELLEADTNAAFVGRTIERIDASCCNIWKFYFTDGSNVSISYEYIAPNLYGLVILTEQKRKKDDKDTF